MAESTPLARVTYAPVEPATSGACGEGLCVADGVDLLESAWCEQRALAARSRVREAPSACPSLALEALAGEPATTVPTGTPASRRG
jgi:hypothetical protein